jgi:hypothetical protein
MSREEINELVARHVMNGRKESVKTLAPKPLEYWYFSETHQPWVNDWKPSEDIAAAMEVAEKTDLFSRNALLKIDDKWCVGELNFPDYCVDMLSMADTAPMAICLGALRAKGIEVEVVGKDVPPDIHTPT